MDTYELEMFFQIVEYGNFFFPAWRHYGNPQLNVKCDRCQRTNLSCCIGFKDKDLCLKCADYLAERMLNNKPIHPPPFLPDYVPSNPPMTFMMQDMFNPPITRMEQNMFNMPVTKMRQNFFKKNDNK